jgi:general secretion pathway protein J
MTPVRTLPKAHGERPRGHNSKAGFTLVELLVALTLFGFLSLALLGGLRFGTRAWEAAEQSSDRINNTTAVRGLLQRQLEQSEIPTPEKSDEPRQNIFLGSTSSLEFSATAPGYVGYGGLTDFKLELTEDDGLVLSWRVNRPEEDPERGYDNDLQEETERRRVLLSDVESLTMRYYGRHLRDDQATWYDNWTEDGLLPQLVEVTIVFAEGDRRSWPPLVISLKKQPILSESS